MKKLSLLSILAITAIFSIFSCSDFNDHSSSSPSSDGSSQSGGSSSSNQPSSSSASSSSNTSSSSSHHSSSGEETISKASLSFGELLPSSDFSTSPTNESYLADGIGVSSVVFNVCYGTSRTKTNEDSYALKMGSGKKTGSFTINFNKKYIIKQANIYASKYKSDSAVEYRCFTSANQTGMKITIDSETKEEYSYLYLDNEIKEASSSLTFEASGKGRIYVYKVELLISNGGGGSLDSGTSSSSSQSSDSSSSSSWGQSSEFSSSSSSSSSDTTPDIESSGYYQGVDWNTSGAELKTSLHSIISKNAKAIGYDALWNAYESSDVKEDGTIWDMYSNESFDPRNDRAGNYKKEGDCYNREHTIPQSSWKGTGGSGSMKCDLFHVVPTDGYVNNIRSSYPHGNVSNATYTSKNGSKLGTGDNNGYNGTVFEVIDEYKGDFARSYFYFVTRYQNYIPSVNYAAFAKNTYPSLSSWALKTYLAWNDLDPVSEKEIKRNEAVYKIQNNRNPFIDHPEAVDKIWGSYR